MKNIKKILFALISCWMTVAVTATEVVALAPGTYSLSSAQATSGSKKFNMYQNIYYGRNGGGLAGNNGVEVKTGSMFAFKIKDASTVKFKVRNSKTKSITDKWDVKAISESDFKGIIAQYDVEGNASTYYSNSGATITSLSITHTGVVETYTNETSILQPGYYGFYLSSHSADGDFISEIVITGSGPVVSSDATLKSIVYGSDNTPVAGFKADKLDYEVELPATYVSGAPSVQAEANDAKADVDVTQASTLPGTAKIDVTAEDGSTKQQYTVTFTKESADPKVESATWANIKGTAAIDQVNKTITGQVTNGSSLTLEPQFTGKYFDSWVPTGAQDFSADPIEYTFSAATGEETKYIVTITEAPAPPAEDYCAALQPAATGDTPAKGAEVALKEESYGGKIIFADAKDDNYEASFIYTDYGLQMSKGGRDSVRVVLESILQAGSVIKLDIYQSTLSDTKVRGFILQNTAKKTLLTAAWQPTEEDKERICTYTVTANDGIDGTSSFIIQRSNTAVLKAVYVSNCSTPPEPEKSHDATLKSIVYGADETPVPGFKADQFNYDVELPIDYVGGAPSVQAEANDAKADANVTQATTLPGTATIDVTAEDGETKLQYSVTFTKESADPKVLTATWDNIKGTATIDQVNKTITGQVLNGSSLTLEPQFTGKYLDSWVPTGAQDFSAGPIEYTFSAATGEETKYIVTITETPAASSDATLSSLKYNGTSVPNFSPNTLIYNIELPKGTTTPPTVTAEKNDAKAQAPDITQAPTLPGTATVVVIAEDGTTSLTYTINFTVEVPQSGLKTHEPGIYEASKIDGGYNTALTVVGDREYEVYYTERTADGDFPTFSTEHANEGKATGISGSTSKTKNEGREGDKWFEGTIASHSECKNASTEDEFVFATKMIREHRLGASDTYQFKVQGFDQFSLWGMDKKLDPKNGDQVFVVKVDGIVQPIDESLYDTKNYTIRRFTLTPGEHLIEISTTCTGSNVCYMGGFSLRVAQMPRVMYIDGNDSSQVVKAGRELEPIYYYTKYNKFGETRLIWDDGIEATGVTLSTYNSDAVGDTLVLSGTPVCPAGEYKYRVESYTAGGVMTKSISGKFSVIYEISFNNEEDTIAEAYQGEEMDYPIIFNYYAHSADDISLEWDGEVPEGITGTGSNGRYTITGTPTTLGTYNYTISVEGGNSLKGQLSVIELNLGEHPILYLQNKRYAYKDDGIYYYLKEQKGYNLVQRVTKDGLRPAAQYEQYDWILISEDVNADNGEVLAIDSGRANRPVLNMKSFSYAPNRLDWGQPDNGSITDEGRFITVSRGDHPIFKNWKHNGDKIQILNQINRKGLMPVEVHYDGTLCLATALTRDTNYYKDGDPATFLHEVPADMRNGYKYICMPIALNSSFELAQEGKQLLEKVITYLQNDEPTVEPTKLEIKSFLIDTIAGVIDNINNTITFEINRSLFPGDIEEYLSAVVPTVTLADPENSYLIPDPNEPIDMNWTKWIPLTITVTDHVSQRVYTITINLWSLEGIEEVYTAGDWVNVFDIYGRKIATTNEDIYSMALPHGMYIVVTENGQTLKIMR